MIDQYLEEFFFYLASEKGLSPNTVEAYRRDTIAFCEFLSKSHVADFNEVKQNHLVDHLGIMKAQGYASSSMCRSLMALKVLFRFLN